MVVKSYTPEARLVALYSATRREHVKGKLNFVCNMFIPKSEIELGVRTCVVKFNWSSLNTKLTHFQIRRRDDFKLLYRILQVQILQELIGWLVGTQLRFTASPKILVIHKIPDLQGLSFTSQLEEHLVPRFFVILTTF